MGPQSMTMKPNVPTAVGFTIPLLMNELSHCNHWLESQNRHDQRFTARIKAMRGKPQVGDVRALQQCIVLHLLSIHFSQQRHGFDNSANAPFSSDKVQVHLPQSIIRFPQSRCESTFAIMRLVLIADFHIRKKSNHIWERHIWLILTNSRRHICPDFSELETWHCHVF